MPSRASFPPICIALGFPTPGKLIEHARREVDAGETFLEFRLDYLPKPAEGVAAIRGFLNEHPECVILATCRRHQNHGRFNGSIEEQLAILSDAVDAGARAVDVEIESAESALARLEGLKSKCFFIVSYHNYEGTPQLDPLVKRMARVGADSYKIVTTAKKPSDSQRVLALAKAHPKLKFVMLAMGEAGFPTRVLSPALGGLYTYAAPSSAEGTAAGQVSAKQLRTLYRIEKFTKAAKVFGVIADPVRHSISPHVHNRALQARRIDGVYLPFLVKPIQLRDFLLLAGRLPLAGFSVTIPHKQKIMRYLDTIDPLARRIGAVNTVWRKAGKWRGTNTDAAGVTKPLDRRLRISKASVLVVGNGGAARGAAFALADAGAKIAITGRNADRVRALAKVCGAETILREQLRGGGRHFDAVVHATSLGMFPHVEECFFEDEIPADLVFDLVYNPLETALLKRAAEQNRETVTGLEMFVEQAVRQFEIFTGETAPRAVMEKAAQEALA
ncbi:MAG: shikimate dehydrogenase [Bryobacteraceae bacterium]|jgi:3-dehydroquinate dehydratase/shikimate dehydrogenase|nr:shikimate dehydrogenase [Bryobacteraceae bacterium]